MSNSARRRARRRPPRLAEVARALGGVASTRHARRPRPGHAQRVVGAELDPVERAVDRGAGRVEVARHGGQLAPAARRAGRGTAARASRPPARRRASSWRRAASRSSRAERELGLAQARGRAPRCRCGCRSAASASAASAPPTSPVSKLSARPAALAAAAASAAPATPRAPRARPRAPRRCARRDAATSDRFAAAIGDVEQAAALARDRQRPRSASAPSSMSPRRIERHAERVEGAHLVRERAAAPSSRACSASASRATATACR